MRAREFFFTILGLSVATLFLAHAVALAPSPSFAEIAYGFVPFLVLATIVAALILLIFTRERLQSISSDVIRTACVACGIALFASLLHVWNDGRYDLVLSPMDAFVSILTLGLFPFKAGPDILVRFFPVVFAIGVFLRLRWFGGGSKKQAVAAFSVYVILAGFTNALSWIAGALARIGRETLQSSADAIRLLIRAQADGYWTRAQADRFFTPTGLQADNSFLLIHAAVIFLGIAISCILIGRREIRGFHHLVKRLLSRHALLFGIVMLLGVAIGNVNRVSWSYTDILASFVFIVSAFAWLLFSRIRRDLASIENSVGAIHELPLPAIARCALLFALSGSFVLGWPVCLGFLMATIGEIGRDAFGANGPRATALRNAVACAVMAASLGSAALALATRDALAPLWMLRLVFAIAVLVGLEPLFHHLEIFSRSRGIQAVILLICLAASFFLADQRVLWIFFFPIVAFVFITVRDAVSWPRRRAVPIPIILLAIGFVVFFAPKLLNA